MLLKRFPALVLLVFIPISLLAHGQDWGDAAVFVTSALAIAPLAIFLSRATEELALALGPTVGGLMNAVFGNATELIISLAALRRGLVDLVKASITGSILGDLLLVLGLAMLLGGLKYKEQSFEPIVVRVNGSSMTLAVTAIALPTIVINTSNFVDAQDIANLSIIVAVVLIVVYGLTLLFSLKTHSYLYDVCKAKQDPQLEENGRSPLWVWIGVLLLATVGIAVESELFVGVVEEVIADWALTPLFTGVVLLPLLGDVSGYVTAVRVAMKNNMDLPVSVAMGSSLLVALFVAPVLVLVGQAMGQPMDLDFNPFEAITVAIAVFIVNLISLNGRSNWLDGTLLLATYAILAAAFYYHPA
ncbi:calcium/proton exchanger [Thermoleptolyngbya sichuanensis A183]|uniref:Ca(2+)/H(+) antiporter n=1 Tax=Thermoleptolyngbya sichuanensis A183 TaxID=2737172 RepID=A0A6M8B4W3_9CYAN|nr:MULTISPECIES: calcium/proton exchanger [Thermoleptolyngbya]MDG2615326.1 calcium/proton exchanger [Thermoleptolyngbya sichuanensis XZ-Cy5]QKD81062.1 calcium/proton exchanger [Thermoleptolyngbya sichuanensis A183]